MSKTKRKRRKAALRREAVRRRAIPWNLIAVAVLVLVAGTGALWYVANQPPPPGQAVPSLGNQHVQPGQDHIPYNSDPPTSGPHYVNLAPWGIHDSPIERELQVHNLEDGGVLVQYSCDQYQGDCDQLIERLAQIVQSYPTQVILAPYPDMDSAIALTAWTRIDKFDEFDEERIRRFIDAYRGKDHHVRR